jgi:hypothetical protein
LRGAPVSGDGVRRLLSGGARFDKSWKEALAGGMMCPQNSGVAPMFGLLNKLRRLRRITSTIVFDEEYCHSAGPDSGGRIYKIRPGTTQLVFVFPDYDGFMARYFFDNPYLDDWVRRSLSEKTGVFSAHVVQEATYVCADRVGLDGRLSLSSWTLSPFTTHRKFGTFSNGALGFGIFHPHDHVFSVLWATMYETDPAA